MKETYTANARRGGHWWAIDVPELPGVFSQARRLDQVEVMARDAIALFLEVPAHSFDVTVAIQLDPEAKSVVANAQTARSEAVEYQAKASVAQRVAARRLMERGYTTRDIGGLLKISHQRVAQLLATSSTVLELEDALAASVAALAANRRVDEFGELSIPRWLRKTGYEERTAATAKKR